MKTIKQALVMAGGRGTRLSAYENPDECKSLISYRGQTMIERLVGNLYASGFTDVMIATWPHALGSLQALFSSYPYVTVYEEDGGQGGYLGVAHALEKRLNERFLWVCGHHPVSVAHLKDLQLAARNYDCAVSMYRNTPDRVEYFKQVDPTMQYFVATDDGYSWKTLSEIRGDEWCIRNPHLVTRSFVASMVGDGEPLCAKIISYCETHNLSCAEVAANMPGEFDYDFELDETRKYLDRLLLTDSM